MITSLEQEEDPKISAHAQSALSREVETTIMPILKMLKKSSAGPLPTSRLINRLETNVQHLMQSYGHLTRPVVVYQRLSPVEALVASMVRQGLTSQKIAEALNVSTATIKVHRKHIRKKLGLYSKAGNLRGYLLSLLE
jgi:DNA-binding NarL/FixJ family response regulator